MNMMAPPTSAILRAKELFLRFAVLFSISRLERYAADLVVGELGVALFAVH